MSLRLANGALVAMDKFDLLYPALGWLGWVPSVAVGVLLARRHHIRALRRRELRRRPDPQLSSAAA